MQNLNKLLTKQKGAALILMAFIIGLGVLAYLLNSFNLERMRLEQDKKTYQTLNQAKQALIAWAVSHPNTPGLMPYPDRKNDGNYDDTSDCYASAVNFNYIFSLGRLPLFRNDPNCINAKADVIFGVSGDFRDGNSERLWYEVSKNLLHDYKNNGGNPNGTSPIINPSIINAPAYPWFTVIDRSGTVISNRVAAVIIAPGQPIGGQDRSGGVADPNQYLDKITMADNTVYENYNYPTSDINVKEFIIGDNLKAVARNDPTYKDQSVEPYYYNDKLVYITIDELMAALEKRVGEEVRNALKRYHDTNGFYPYAAKLGSTKLYACETNNQNGFLPVTNPAPVSATCNYNRVGFNVATDCAAGGFGNVNSILLRRSVTNFTAEVGACTFSGRNCSCTGAGNCSRGAQTFQCDANANCNYTSTAEAGEIRFIGGDFDVATKLGRCTAAITPGDACQMSAVDVRCAGIGAGSATRNVCTDPVFNTGTSQLPAWFINNRWQDYVYYELTRPTDMVGLTVGNKAAGAAVVSTGRPINSAPFSFKGSAQIKPSCLVNDYLDSSENVSTNSTYDTTSLQRTSNYNDQTFVVPP